VLAVFALLLWLVRGILLPFVVAMVIAAVLDPALNKLQRRGVPRGASVIVVYIAFFVLFGILLTWLLPIVIAEAQSLARQWPTYVDRAQKLWTSFQQSGMADRFHLHLPSTTAELTNTLVDYFKRQGPKLLSGLIGGVFGTVQYVLNIVIILIATFYMLNDWPRMKKRFRHVIPPQFREQMMDVTERVGVVFLGYLRGLTIVCLLYGATVTVLLLLLGLIPGVNTSYAFLLGIIAAPLYAVPYIGALVLVLITAIVTYVGPGGNALSALVVTGTVAVLNSALFDPILMPKIVGRSTGMHPLLALFAVLAGSELFGLPGFILGVPVAASIGIMASALYPPLSDLILDEPPAAEQAEEPE